MEGGCPTPGQMDRSLDDSLSARMSTSSSRVPAVYRETTVCYAYMCPYAYGCVERAARPAQVLRRRCMRYLPQWMRVTPTLSDLALDLLAGRRQRGEYLSPETVVVLDRLRPNGPVRKGL